MELGYVPRICLGFLAVFNWIKFGLEQCLSLSKDLKCVCKVFVMWITYRLRQASDQD